MSPALQHGITILDELVLAPCLHWQLPWKGSERCMLMSLREPALPRGCGSGIRGEIHAPKTHRGRALAASTITSPTEPLLLTGSPHA